MTLSAGSFDSLDLRAFSFSLLNTFSTSIIASSTREPMAIVIPPRLIVLMVMPINFGRIALNGKQRPISIWYI